VPLRVAVLTRFASAARRAESLEHRVDVVLAVSGTADDGRAPARAQVVVVRCGLRLLPKKGTRFLIISGSMGREMRPEACQ